MSDYLAPVFLFLFSASIIVFVVAMMRWRSQVYALGGHLFLVALALIPLSFFFFSNAVRRWSLGDAAPLLIGGGIVLFAALVVQTVAVYKFVQTGSERAASAAERD